MLKDRHKKILTAVIKEYILTAEPVSSKAIATRYIRSLSPATIRNAMAMLEKEGFLMQPHTSAGRVPTEKAFRFYVDSLIEFDRLLKGDKELIRTCYKNAKTLDNIMRDTAKVLSSLTSCAGFMLAPRLDLFVIKHIRILPIDRDNLMVIIVSVPGAVKTKIVRVDEKTRRLDFEKVSNYLNSISEGLTLRELRAKIIEEMRKEKNLYDELLRSALRLGEMAFEPEPVNEAENIYVEGAEKVLEQPEFREDFEKMKRLFAAFEEKGLLVKLLDKSIEESGIHIWLGSESSVEEFDGLSFVTSTYGRDDTVLGAFGVIGPVRMNYSKIVPLVNYMAGYLSKVF